MKNKTRKDPFRALKYEQCQVVIKSPFKALERMPRGPRRLLVRNATKTLLSKVMRT